MELATPLRKDANVIKLPARFDFTQMQDFRSLLEEIQGRHADEILVDFGSTRYLDSSALSMLLLLRDRARKHGMDVVLAGASGNVQQVLRIANFEKLFAFR